MVLPAGWVTDPSHDLTTNQQNTALGNGVLPLHAALALNVLSTPPETLATDRSRRATG